MKKVKKILIIYVLSWKENILTRYIKCVIIYNVVLNNTFDNKRNSVAKKESVMKFKIVSDSASDIMTIKEEIPFESVPLKIICGNQEYVDDSALDVDTMISDLEKYKGKTSSSCPNTSDWISAFGDSEYVFCITITSGLSGSYNSANAAASEYVEKHPDRRVCVIDSLSTGPENALIIEKICEYIKGGLDFDTIANNIKKYQKRTHLIFALESLHNLVNNGRVSAMSAKIAGIIGIRIVGVASSEGTLEITNKSRGAKKTLADIIDNMKKFSYQGGKVRIHHCQNPEGAEEIRRAILSIYPDAKVEIGTTAALCSYYAESGGVLVGYEDGREE